MDYQFGASLGAAIHGGDLGPLFWNSDVDIAQTLIDALGPAAVTPAQAAVAALVFPGFAQRYQTYLVSHAITGDPNALLHRRDGDGEQNWPNATAGVEFGNVMVTGLFENMADPFFELGTDAVDTAAVCDFWKGLAKELMQISLSE